jgi:hypothetical protein
VVPGLLAGLVLALPARLTGQRLVRGQLVRVSAPSVGMSRERAELVALANDTLVVDRQAYIAGQAVPSVELVRTRIPVAEVARLEVWKTGRHYTLEGALIGLAAGAVAGSSIGRSLGTSNCGAWFILCIKVTAEDKATIYGVMGALVGTTVGAVVGSKIGGDHWGRVPLDRLQVSFVPLPAGRVVVGAAIRL